MDTVDVKEILRRIKLADRRTGNYDDENLTILIEMVIADLKRYGVPENVLMSNVSIGTIALGVWERDNLKKYTSDFYNEAASLREVRLESE